MNKPKGIRKHYIEKLYKFLKDNPTVPLKVLLARFAIQHGLTTKKVQLYVRYLEERERRRKVNGLLIDNLAYMVNNKLLEIPSEFKDLVKEFLGLEGKTREECIEYLDECPLLRTLAIACYPLEKKHELMMYT